MRQKLAVCKKIGTSDQSIVAFLQTKDSTIFLKENLSLSPTKPVTMLAL